MFKNGITIIAIIAIILLASGCTNYRQATDKVSNMTTVPESSKSSATINGNTLNYADLYKPIINAYIALEQSGYTSYDEKILSKDVCLIPGGSGSYFIDNDNKPVLVFAFCNLGGDDTPELLIGADLGIADGADIGSNVFVTGIYGLRDDKPVSLIQVCDWSQLNFFADNNGNPVIKKISGTHIDYAEEDFYTIDKNETLITLDKLYTYGKINDINKPDDISYSHTKDINGKEVSITELEYLALMQEYGSVGYLDNTGDFKANEIVINSWELLSMYKNKGPANNTVTPINNTSRTDKLNDKGVTVIENQSFQIKLENWGEVRFVSAYTADGRARLSFFLVDSDDNILYEFPDFSGNTWAFSDMLAVSFKDVNNDGLEDIIIIAEYLTGVGENGATPFNVAGIYFQKDKEFIELPELDRELNDNSKNQTIDMIIKYLNGREIKLE